MSQEFKTLIFSVGEMLCGIPSNTVREVISRIEVIPIHDGPNFLSGAILRHDRVLPLIDVRLLMGLDAGTTFDDQTCVIICKLGNEETSENTRQEDKEILVGALVERLHETTRVKPEDVIQPPTIGGRKCVGYLTGITQAEGSITLLLDLAALLDSRSLSLTSLDALAAEPAGESR